MVATARKIRQEERCRRKEQRERADQEVKSRGKPACQGSLAQDSQLCPGGKPRGGDPRLEGAYEKDTFHMGLENYSSLWFPQQADSEAARGFTELGKGSSGTSKDRGSPGHPPQVPTSGVTSSFAGKRGRYARRPGLHPGN